MKSIVAALILSTVSLLSQNWPGSKVNSNFVDAIWQVESGKRIGAIPGDYVKGVATARGPLQIHLNCFKDSGVKGNYSRCSELEFSVKVMEGYLLRYEKTAVKSNDFESMARLWNAGPNWRKTRLKSDNYWFKVKSALTVGRK
jgi:hypothetical protein